VNNVSARPDERTFQEHLARGAYLRGVTLGRWQLLQMNWPEAVFHVRASPRPSGPDRYALKLDLAGYPQQGPTARLWDVSTDEPLAAEAYPTGPAGSRVERAFRTDWNNGAALYLPCDRVALKAHPNWLTLHPSLAWNPDRDIAFFLEIVHDLLHSSTYTGTRSA
jgi:hypothetical protein